MLGLSYRIVHGASTRPQWSWRGLSEARRAWSPRLRGVAAPREQGAACRWSTPTPVPAKTIAAWRLPYLNVTTVADELAACESAQSATTGPVT